MTPRAATSLPLRYGCVGSTPTARVHRMNQSRLPPPLGTIAANSDRLSATMNNSNSANRTAVPAPSTLARTGTGTTVAPDCPVIATTSPTSPSVSAASQTDQPNLPSQAVPAPPPIDGSHHRPAPPHERL